MACWISQPRVQRSCTDSHRIACRFVLPGSLTCEELGNRSRAASTSSSRVSRRTAGDLSCVEGSNAAATSRYSLRHRSRSARPRICGDLRTSMDSLQNLRYRGRLLQREAWRAATMARLPFY
ncbi:hypothetical protein K523DRAFT_114096 [Schizophyllum commune Tattone D]|nr:hypothetical protein K523DRAFT_114096 [Schizophyllum commune Tattone D]